jgi:hypothetical protein
MFRKIVLSTVAVLGLTAAVVGPTQASPHYRHREIHPVYYHAYGHREFCSWAEANAWMRFERAHGHECHFEWHGPNCWVFYR